MAQKDPIILKKFDGGLNTETTSDYLDVSMSPDLENVDFSSSGSVKKDWGFAELSSDSDSATSKEMFVFPDRNGVEWLLKRNDTKLKIYDSVLGRFDTIRTGLNASAKFAAEYFDTVVYFSSDIDTGFTIDLSKITRLNGAVVAAAATITVDSTAAFDAAGNIYINGAVVAYTGKTATEFTGCTGTPDADDNSLVIAEYQSASEIPKSVVTAVYAGRLYVAVGSTLYGSKLADLTDFTVAGSGTGDAVEKTLESKINALRVFFDDNNNLRMLGFAANNKIYVIDTLDDADLSSTITTSSRFKESVTALNQNTSVVGFNDMYHINLENQVCSLGQHYAESGVNKIYSDVMSISNRRLFKNSFHFDEGKAVIFNGEYWCACRYGDGETNNRLIIVDLKTNAWRQRTDINANWIEFYNNKLIWTDATSNKVFYLDESLLSGNDESIKFKYSSPDLDVEKLRFERLRRVRIAGFMSVDCEFNVSIYRDFATIKIADFTVSGNNADIVGAVSSCKGVFGKTVFGGEMFGGSGGGRVRFFIADLELESLPDFENFRIVFENDQPNVYLEITAVKPFIMPLSENYFPDKIINSN